MFSVGYSATVQPGQIDLSWTEDSGHSWQHAWVNRWENIYEAGWGSTAFSVDQGSASSLSDTDVVVGQTYYYQVVLQDDSGSVDTSAVFSVAPDGTVDVVPPFRLAATSSGYADSLDLTWYYPDSDAHGFYVARFNPDPGMSQWLDPTSSGYTDTGLQPGTTYSYQVVATLDDNAVYFADSNVASATTAPLSGGASGTPVAGFSLFQLAGSANLLNLSSATYA